MRHEPAGGWRRRLAAPPRLRINVLLCCVALYLAAVLNLPFWQQVLRGLPVAPGLAELRLLLALGVALVGLLLLVMLPLSSRHLVRPALAALLLLAAVCNYFIGAFGTVIDRAMIATVLNTDWREAGELMVPRLFLQVALLGGVPAWLVWRTRLATGSFLRELRDRAVLALGIAAVVLLTAALSYKDVSLWVREHREVRMYVNPTYPLYAVIHHFRREARAAEHATPVPIALDARRAAAVGARPRVTILVVGETDRAQNHSLLGYPRITNPELAAIPGLVAFGQVTSCATATAYSVPCMFSRLGRARFSRAKARAEENVLDVLQRTGVDVLWKDNNSDCMGVCRRVPTQDVRHLQVADVCDVHGCRDEVLLAGLDPLLDDTQGDRLIVLHVLGSHGPAYYRRYPPAFRRFVPDCARDDVRTCSRDEIVNAYDNTVLYTDHVLAQLIALLDAHRAQLEPTLLYVSDHGESLGEQGVYLHGLPYAIAPDAQTHVPLFVWAPDRDPACLRTRAAQPASHDNLFHTLLGAFAVTTREYRAQDDLLAGC